MHNWHPMDDQIVAWKLLTSEWRVICNFLPVVRISFLSVLVIRITSIWSHIACGMSSPTQVRLFHNALSALTINIINFYCVFCFFIVFFCFALIILLQAKVLFSNQWFPANLYMEGFVWLCESRWSLQHELHSFRYSFQRSVLEGHSVLLARKCTWRWNEWSSGEGYDEGWGKVRLEESLSLGLRGLCTYTSTHTLEAVFLGKEADGS